MAHSFSHVRNIISPLGRMGGVFLFFICLFTTSAASAQYMVHIAGNDSCGHYGDGGLAIAASFRGPAGICQDAAGNFYIGDGSNTGENDARVRKINAATGIITTIAGGVYFSPIDTPDNVPATNVNLDYAGGICIDKTGNLLIADGLHYRLRKVNVTTTGIITTIAGIGASGYSGDEGPATAAILGSVNYVAIDSANNIYISQPSTVRKITAATGVISTIAGVPDTAGFRGDGGPATAALMKAVGGLYLDYNSNIYICDWQNYRIRKLTAATGIITTVAGIGTPGFFGDGGPATAANLHSPIRVTMDKAGNLYISDLANKRIRKVDSATGIITTFAGNGAFPVGAIDSDGDNGPATAAAVDPFSMCFDTCGNMYFADGFCRIRAITPSLPFIRNCGDTAVISGISQQATANDILQLYPDPNRGSFIICLSAGTAGQAQITITNILGQKIKEITTTTNKKEQVQLTAPPGMYFINAVTEHGMFSGKVVVQ